VALRAFFCMGVILGSTYLLTGLSVASCWIGGSAGRWIGRSVAVRARGCGGDVLGLLVGSRRVAHAQRPRDEDDREVGQ